MKDFFISYTKADKAWAEWIAWTLEAAGYSTVIQVWDFLAGSNFVLEMQRAATEANRTIAVLSQKYLDSSFTQPEWAAAFAQDPQGKKQKLIPVRIATCELTGILASIVYLDLVGLPENDARTALLGAFSIRNKPDSAPAFPGTRTPQAPGVSPTQPTFPGVPETMSAPVAEILSSVAENADQSRRLSASQRLQFIRQLNEIVPQQFNMLLFAVKPPAGLVPPMPAAQGDRTTALLTWAESPGGCGLSVLQQLRETIVDPPVGPSPQSVPSAARRKEVQAGIPKLRPPTVERGGLLAAFRKKLWWFVLGTLAVAGIAICFPIFAEAKRYFALKTAAEAGSAEAMYKLGDLYKNGWGGVAIARNYEDARVWYKKAADGGNAWGMYDLGDLYKNGLGVTKDYIEARDWFERARRAGNPDSMYGLGDLYKNGGYGVDQDYGQAREWYQNAADAGSAWGMYDLAQLYEDGLLGASDYAKARYWYRRAVEKGDEPPKKSAEEGLRRLLQPSNSK